MAVSPRTRFLLVLLVNVVLAAGSVWALRHFDVPEPSDTSYLLVFLATAVASATPFVAAPAQLIVFAFGGHLPAVPLALWAGLGSMVGEFPTFWLGHESRSLGIVSRQLDRMRTRNWWRWLERTGPFGLIAVAAVPNPFLDFASLAAGMSRMRLYHYLPAILVGRTIRFALLAGIGQRMG